MKKENAVTNRTTETPALVYARVAGFAYLAIAILGIFVNFFVIQGLVVPGDAAATADQIAANETLFRFGVAGWLVVLGLDALVAWALYVLLAPVSKTLSLLAAWFRLIYVAIFAATQINLLSALQLVKGASFLSALETSQSQALAMLFLNRFDSGFLIGLVFFGVHLFVLGYLVFKSGYMPRILGVLLIVAALGYLTDSFAHFLLANYETYASIFLVIVALPAVVAEFSFTFWLLYMGFKRPAVA
jgi:Domain of unknown function (DUF4386)